VVRRTRRSEGRTFYQKTRVSEAFGVHIMVVSRVYDHFRSIRIDVGMSITRR
jgi:hypothetical protein